MRMYNKLLALAIGACSFFAACDNGSSTEPIDKSAEAPDTPTFTASTCQEVTDEAVAAELEAAKSNIDDILIRIGEGNLRSAQVMSSKVKSTFKSVLDKYPSNCEAQLGYALSIVTDLINNKEIKAFVDTVTNKTNIADLGVKDFNQILIAGDGKHLTTMAQEAMAQAIPSLDSAIIYMKNIVSDDKFVCSYTYEDRRFELDRGEFAPALSLLYIAKAVLTFGASINIDFSKDNKYDWINEQNERNTITNETANQIIALMDKSSSFTTVYNSWKPRYKDIPNMLDSAITYVEIGLQHGIEESKTGLTTQRFDPYIVGDDEFSDVSAKDFQKAIDSLEYYRGKLHTGITVTFPHGSQVTINLAKFFDITDGWQDYLPYHKFNDPSIWNIPADGYFWSTDPDYSYAEEQIQDAIYEQVSKGKRPTYFSAYLYTYGGWYDEPTSTRVCVEYENGSSYSDACYNAIIDNCTVTFRSSSNDYSENELASYVPSAITLTSAVCRVENGQSMFATPFQSKVPNAFYFTDAAGNKTISYQALANGKIDEATGAIKDYNLDEIKNFLFFPDITFGGILPGMTADAFWKFLITESRNDVDEDWRITIE